MKNLLILLLIGISNLSFSQDFSTLEKIKLDSPKDYQKAETNVIAAVNYLYATPFNKNDLNRMYATAFIVRWMTGTPDYTFNLDTEVLDYTKGNENLLTMYIAAMGRIVLVAGKVNYSDIQINHQAVKALAQYCGNSSNNLKPSKKLKKYLRSKVY
jgi:hypothetical protein